MVLWMLEILKLFRSQDRKKEKESKSVNKQLIALGQQAVNLSHKDLLNILWELVHKETETI